MIIYADNAATTKMSRAAVEAMLPYFEEQFGNPSSLYTLGQRAKEAIEGAREEIAGILSADPKEITFTSGGSEADNQALRSAAENGRQAGKKHIISTAFEHHAVLHTLKKLEGEGFDVTLLPVHEDGLVRPEELEAALREDTCLVTVMYANNEIGTIQPIRELGGICRDRGVVFHTDEEALIMALYSEKVMDHFRHPRNVGVIEDADGVGEVGNAKCGDIMKMYLKIQDDTISDVKFETFGCGSAIASSSMATELIKGKPVSEAMQLTNKAVTEALDGLPDYKLHCSVLAEEAIRSALDDYYQKHPEKKPS